MYRWFELFWPTSRKARFFLVVLIVAAAIIAGFFALRAKKSQPSFDGERIALKLRQDRIEKLQQDSDHDGLKDWEEILYHTDPHNPDTDGDGTSDGEEVKLGRDPTKPNTSKNPKKPSDYFTASTPLPDSASTPNTGTNLTADFARSFLRQPLAKLLVGEKANIDTKAVERYADQLKGRSMLADAEHFTAADIRTIPDDKTAAAQYLNSLQRIFNTLDARGDNELIIISDAIESQDYGAVALIATYPDAYQKAITDLGALPTPKGLADFHLSVLNYLSRFKRSVELLQGTETDPILAILVINERLKLNIEFSKYLDSAKDKIVAQLQP